jgi:hypothetical protein
MHAFQLSRNEHSNKATLIHFAMDQDKEQDKGHGLRHRSGTSAVADAKVSAEAAFVNHATALSSDKHESKNEKDPRTTTLQKRQASWKEWAAATIQVSFHDWILIATMIFGGCCSNVFALEILVK